MFAVLCSDGAIKPQDILGQLRTEQWVPLAVTRPRNQPDATPTLLLFDTEIVAKKFAVKNFPKDWMISVVQLSSKEHEWIIERGWHLLEVKYAKVMNSHPDYELGYDILQFDVQPDVSLVRERL